MNTRPPFDDFVEKAIKKPSKTKLLRMHSYTIKEDIQRCKKLCKTLVPDIDSDDAIECAIEGIPVLTWEEHKALKTKSQE